MISEFLPLLITLVIIGIIFYLITRYIIFGVLSKHYSKKYTTKYEKKYIVIDDTIIDKGDPYEIIDPVLWNAIPFDDEDEYPDRFKPFSEHQRYILAITLYEFEVNNGGHNQFYTNTTGIVWQDALEGLKRVGANKYAKILEESIKRFGEKPSLDRSIRLEQIEKNNLSFIDLNKMFYSLQSEINLMQLMSDFIKKNREDFYFEGEVSKPKKRLM